MTLPDWPDALLLLMAWGVCLALAARIAWEMRKLVRNVRAGKVRPLWKR